MNSELVKAWVGALKFFLFIAVIFIVLYATAAIYIYQSMRSPEVDQVYIGYLEYYARDSLPSCRVIHKKYFEDEYSSAICRLDKADFEKLLEGARKCEYSKDSVIKFNDSALKILKKENIKIEELDFKYNLFKRDIRIGFKYPDLVIYDRILYE